VLKLDRVVFTGEKKASRALPLVTLWTDTDHSLYAIPSSIVYGTTLVIRNAVLRAKSCQ